MTTSCKYRKVAGMASDGNEGSKITEKPNEEKQEGGEGKQAVTERGADDKQKTGDEKGKSSLSKAKENQENDKAAADQKKEEKIISDVARLQKHEYILVFNKAFPLNLNNYKIANKFRDAAEEPRNVIFKVPPEKKPIWSDIKLQNPTNENKTFKVKCTSAVIFRVQPPFGLVKANETTKIRVWFQNTNGIPSDGKKHYFAIYFMNSEEGKLPKEMWRKDSKPEGCFRNTV
ncbi:MSP domain protein [Dictyocaulus viviparus]|uniref:Major sperm protein n=1 Tax=Dictyocaulus viviparus TaxID=29172 RepID=A0A0D8Y328_DICVI|nr:MSP domain protein [Dictyocaulus viviparus]